MENNEISFWEIYQMLRKKIVVIISIALGMMLISFVGSLLIEKQYQTEMWIKMNENFLNDNSSASIEYTKSFFNYPEVIQSLLQEGEKITQYKNRITLKEQEGLVQVIYTHPKDENSIELLQQWVYTAMLKMIDAESKRHILTLEDNLISYRNLLAFQEKLHLELLNLLAKEKPDNEIVVPGLIDDGKMYIIQAANPSYTDLLIQENECKLNILNHTEMIRLLDSIIIEYKSIIANANLDVKISPDVFNILSQKLIQVRTQYNGFMYQQNGSHIPISVQPFNIVSEPFVNTRSVSPNLVTNVAIAGVMGFLLSFLAVYVSYILKKEVNSGLEL